MNNALLCLIVSILLIMMSYLMLRRLTFMDIDNEQMCGEPAGSIIKEGDECHVWDGTVCRRGRVVNNECVSEGSKIPLVLMVSGLLLLVLSICLYFFGNKEQKFNFGVNGKYRNW